MQAFITSVPVLAGGSLHGAFQGESLAYLMTQPFDLRVAALVHKEVVTVKVLRLVSKNIGRLAVAAIQSCKFFIGAGSASLGAKQLGGDGKPCPNTEQLVRMLARKADGDTLMLKRIKVILIMETGGLREK